MPTVRTNLRKAIAYGLKQITTTGGYRNTVTRVYDPPIAMEKMDEYPTINLLWGREDRTNEHIQGNNQLVDMNFRMQMDVFLDDNNDPALAQDTILADVQEYFGKNFYIPGEDGNRTTFNCLYASSTPFGTEQTRPSCGISIELEVWYRIQITNPNSMV